MAIDDPKTRYKAPADEPDAMTKSEFLVAMQQLIAAIKTTDDPASKERAIIEAERLALEQERLKREMPENKQSPGISVYSYPEGDLKRPKPDLKCRMFWVGYPLTTETLTPREVELLNRLEAGEFRVTKTDGTPIPFRVAAKHNDRMQLEELAISFPCKGEHRHNHGSMVSYMQQALGDRIPSTDELMAEVQKLKAELAASAA